MDNHKLSMVDESDWNEYKMNTSDTFVYVEFLILKSIYIIKIILSESN